MVPEDAGGGGGGGGDAGGASSPRRPYHVEGDIDVGEGGDDVKAGACWAELTPLPPAPPATAAAGAEQPPSDAAAAAAAAAATATAAAAMQPWHTDPILLTQNPFVIGRAQDAVFTTTNPAVSMRHCAVWRRRRRPAEVAAAAVAAPGVGEEDDNAHSFDFYLRDYSSNGVYVNSTRVGKGRELLLCEGDVLHLVRPSSAALQKYSMVYTFTPHVERAQKAATRDIRTDYYLDATLGAGAFAEVKLGTHRSSGNKVAVKIINLKKAEIAAAPAESQQPTQDDPCVPSPSPFDIQAGGGGHDDRRRRRRGAVAAAARKESPREKQLREIEILKQLQHPNTVRVLEVYVSDTQCHIVMELAEGGDLFHLIKKRGSLTPVDSRTVFIQLIHAVDYLHSQGVAHRDIKPENILLARPEDVSCVKLSDFGLAKHFGSQCAELQTTCGTAMYAAPEVIHRQYAQREAAATGAAKPTPLPYTPAVDIWSAGIVLWVMLTGRPPFPKKGVASRRMDYAAGLNFTVPPIPRVSPHLRALLTSIVRNAPAERATAAEILQNVWVREGLPADAVAPAAAAAATAASSSLSSLLASSSSGAPPVSDMPASTPSVPCIPAAKRPRMV